MKNKNEESEIEKEIREIEKMNMEIEELEYEESVREIQNDIKLGRGLAAEGVI